MSNKAIRVHFDLPEDLYEELTELENGKYPNATSYNHSRSSHQADPTEADR